MASNPPQSASAVFIPLQQLWTDNFLVYFKSHTFHFNVQGPTFGQDHALFQEIYEYLWDQHDVLGEQIRQMDKPVLTSLKSVMSASSVDEVEHKVMDTKSMLTDMCEEFDELIELAQSVYDRAESSGCGGLSTTIGDYLKGINKLAWKVKASLGRSIK